MRHEQSQSIPKEWSPFSTKGFSIIEVLLASALCALLIASFTGAIIYGEQSTVYAGSRARASLFAEAGIEAVRNIRDESSANLVDGLHGITTTANQLSFSGSSDTEGIFTRQIAIGTIDSTRKSVTSTVTWQQTPVQIASVSVVTQFTNWTALINNWLSPVQNASVNLSGNNDALKVQVSGNYAYVVRGSNSPNFYVIDISNPNAPFIADTLSLSGTLYNVAISGDYVYVASSQNTAEVYIIDISTPTASVLAGWFNAPGNADGEGVYAVGSVVYLVRSSSLDDEFYIINAAIPAAPSSVGSLNLGSQGNEVYVNGTYAYVASTSNSQELQIVTIANPATPSIAGSYNLSGNTDALTITGVGSEIVIGQGNSLYILNASNHLSVVQDDVVTLSGNVEDIALGLENTLAFVATAANNQEFVVVDISDVSNSSVTSVVNVSGNSTLFGIAYGENTDNAYGVGNSNSEEFIVFGSS